MKNYLLACVFCLLVIPFSQAQKSQKAGVWQSVYHHQPEGKMVSGSKEALLKAIRNGAQVRIYYKMGRVEHLVDADFITIFKGEVFAQIDRIKGQKPAEG